MRADGLLLGAALVMFPAIAGFGRHVARSHAVPSPYTMPLAASVTQDEGLLKHLYSFTLPAPPNEFWGLSGNVAFTTTLNYFGEALVSVNYLASGSCAAVNNTAYASYTAPGFPPLVHLASVIMKATQAGTVTLPMNFTLKHAVRITNCIVVVLDGGGAWGPGHTYGYPVTMASSLQFIYRPITPGDDLTAIPYPIGGEFSLGPQLRGANQGRAIVLRTNPALPTQVELDSLWHTISASPFDASSGGPVPTGAWAARAGFVLYPNTACAKNFAVTPQFQGLFHVDILGIPPGLALDRESELSKIRLAEQGATGGQSAVFRRYDSILLAPGDCLVDTDELRGAVDGVVDFEDQSTAMLRPLSVTP